MIQCANFDETWYEVSETQSPLYFIQMVTLG